MASLNNLKARLSSVSSTQKVIKAMELVASSKIKKAKEKAEKADFYINTVQKSLNEIKTYHQYNKYLEKKTSNKNLYIVITSDMGLCGAYNTNVLKLFEKNFEKDQDDVFMLGTKGIKRCHYTGIKIFEELKNYTTQNELEITNYIMDLIYDKWMDGNYKDIKIIYTDFINQVTQETKQINIFENIQQKLASYEIEIDTEQKQDEEEADIIINTLFKQYLSGLITSTLLKSLASEHAYRRNSMDNANKNSLELIDDMELKINRMRQQKITQEISEIIGGSEASK